MEGDGDLMKMLMHADPADENIQGPMEDTAMVQSGGFPQTGMGFGSTHYGGMQQQMPTISPQRQQQQRGSGYPPMNPGQMIPRSPNNGMMQPDMDVVLQQQQYQQQAQQSAYGNGSYQGYNGGYQGSSSAPPQNHSQTMNPYQAGYPSESGYPPGTSGSQAMGDFGPQAGLNQPMGMPGPASLSLAAMSNRQQYYGDSYGMNQPVSPVHKQVPQGGGFLQPSGMPYSQQVPSYQSSSYPKRPPSSPVQTQMQGFSSGGSSYTPRSSAGMQMPNMPYQTSTNPYQPPRSPSRRSSSTSPVPQQDTGMYSRPHEPFPQPRSPFGPSQGHFQQQQPQQHSSCMFVQPSTKPQAHYQSQQLMAGTKAGGVTRRRASYPGQQNTVQMPSSPLKRSPPSKTPSPNPKSPDFSRAGQLGFEERSSIKKPVAKKVKVSPPSSDPSQGPKEATTETVSNSVQCSFKQKAVTSQKVAEGQKGVPRQKRSASNAERQSVSPPTGNKEGMDEKAEKKSKESNGSNGVVKTDVLSHSPKMQEGDQGETRASNSKGDESSGNVGEERNPSEANKTKTEKGVGEQTISKSPQSIVNHDKEDRKEGEAIVAKSGETDSSARDPIRSKEVLSSKAKGMVNKTLSEGKDVSSSQNVLGKGDELISKIVHKSGNGESEHSKPVKNVQDEDKSDKIGAHVSETSGGTGKAVDKTSKVDRETGETSDTSAKSDIKSAQNVSVTRKTNQQIDETVDKSINFDKATGQLGKTGAEANPDTSGTADAGDNKSTVGEDGKRDFDDEANKMQTLAKEAEVKELVSKGNPSSDEPKADIKTDSSEGTSKVSKEVVSQSRTDGEQAAKPQEKKDKPKVPSLRCDERLSSDDEDRVTAKAKAESESAPVVENRTLGIQTIQQNTATSRATQQQAAPIKATIIAKGKSSQTNQQVMVAKTTTGQMYLIQGNILVPVQTVSTKDDPSKQNPQLIIVNPAKTSSGQQGGTKQPVAAAKGVDRTETSKAKKDEKGQAGNSRGSHHSKASKAAKGVDRTETSKGKKDEKGQVGNSQRSHHNKALKVAVEPKAADESSSSSKKSDEIVQKSERSSNTKTAIKSDKSPTAKASKRSPTQPEKGSNTAVKEKQTNKTESPRLKQSPDSKISDKREEKHSPSEASSKQTSEESTPKMTRGRPLGSKDKQKRKSYVHKVKRKQDDLELEEMNAQELALNKGKFSKTAVAVQQMSSSTESSNKSKRPLEVPTVSATKSPKRRKVSTSSSPVKHISTRPRGGIDGDSWVCSICGKRSGSNLLGDLYGPYKTKFSKEKTDSFSKEGKHSQKLSSPSRKSSSSSDVQVESESCDVELWIHRDCGVWSPGVFMLGRTIHGLEQAVESAAQHKCTKCSEVGATLACFKRGCNIMFHYACARDSGCSFIEDNFTIFCSTHK